MTWPLSEPGDRADPADLAAGQTEINREIALRRHLARVEIAEDQVIDEGGRVLCLWCDEPIEPERLAAEPSAVRHPECQADFEQYQRRHREARR